jgi:DNA polymerase-3 subunit alpha
VVHLHNHTSGSQLDGAIDINRLADKVIEQGENAIGISDHGSMMKVYEMYETCTKKGVKPILGCEFYMGEEDDNHVYHILLIAKDNKGLQNMYKLSTLSYTNFYSKPRISYDMLRKYSEGIICTTACLGSEISKNFMKSPVEAEQSILELKDIFGDRLFLEVQPNPMAQQKKYNIFLMEQSIKHNIHSIVTCDAHYVSKEDYEAHDTLLCMQVQKKKDDEKRFRFSSNDYYLKTDDEVKRELSYLPFNFVSRCIINTHVIADMCNTTIETGRNLLPNMPNVIDPKLELAKLCNKYLPIRIAEGYYEGIDIKLVIERIKYELKVICDKGYAGYFLIVEDYMRYCRETDEHTGEERVYTGAGRGSVGGCEVAFVLKITEIEPIRYGLYFERFQNPDRMSPPDIDGDFDNELRHIVIDYIKNKYGAENVSHIIAEGKLTCKAVIRKVLSVYGYEMRAIGAITKQVPDELNITLSEALEKSEGLRKALEGTKELNDMIILEGLVDHASTHAAGVIVAPSPIDNYVPCIIDRSNGMLVSQWHKKIIEKIGLYKFDILGLKLLTIFRMTLRSIYKNHGIRITRDMLNRIDENDPNIYKLFNSGDLCGIFQFNQPAGRLAVQRAIPQNFNDVMACESICRPGVKEANLYIENSKLFKETGTFPVPDYYEYVKDILDETYGAIVYQEQTMLILNKIGGFTLGQADGFRKVKSLEPYREQFVTNALILGLTNTEANELFDRFDLGYTFNKSHACAYGKNSVQTGYLSYYYPVEFMASCMTVEMTNGEPDLLSFIMQCLRKDIKLLPPDINTSTNEFIPTSEGIMFPLTCIKQVGDSSIKEILEKRPFTSFDDFITRVTKKNVKKTVVINLIKAGVFDNFNKNRSDLLHKFYEFRNESKPVINYWCDEVQIQYEQDVFGYTLGKHPLDGYANTDIKKLENGIQTQIVGIVKEIRVTKDKRGKEMAFLKMNNKLCDYTAVVFSFSYEKFKKNIYNNARLSIRGKIDNENILVDNLEVI